MAEPITVEEVARTVGGDVEGDGGLTLVDVRGLEEAGPEHLSFLANRKYARTFRASRAGAVLIDRNTDAGGRTVIRCDDPYVAFARALAMFHPTTWPAPGIDDRAWVAPDVDLDGVTVEAFAWIGAGARIGAGSWIQAGAHVGSNARLGRSCRLMPHSVVCDGSIVGDRVWLNPGAVVGAEGFGFAPSPHGHEKIPQVGTAVIEDDVEIGVNSCVDRATMGETRVRAGTKLDNLVQIGHGVDVGRGCLMAAYAGVAGSATLGDGVILGAKSGVINHLKIGDGVQLAVHGIITGDQPAGARLAGAPAIDHRTWLRSTVAFAELPQLVRRVRRLEQRLAELDGAGNNPIGSPPESDEGA